MGMWWAIQTVTTVGYGDVTPKAVAGRIVGTFVMLEGIAFLAIITAAITSTFVARAGREYAACSKKIRRATGRCSKSVLTRSTRSWTSSTAILPSATASALNATARSK